MNGKVVIITGASSGIGLATAYEMADKGARLVLAARSLDVLNNVKREIETKGGQVVVVKTDVSVEDDCKNLVQAAVDSYGQIDILINNAGISMRAMFSDLDLSVIRRVMDTNYWGTVYCTKYALPYLLKSKGSVVAISSISGYSPLPGRTGYCSSKYAIHGFLNALRVENLKNGLHVLIAAPGFTSSNIRKSALVADGSAQGDTPRIEEKMMSAESVAAHLYKAIKQRKSSLILTSQGKLLVLLYKCFPRIMDRVIYKQMAKEPNSPFK